jgi:DNA end-binding protein Ku
MPRRVRPVLVTGGPVGDHVGPNRTPLPQELSMQTVWKGSISFGLVAIPVRLFTATEERDVSFRQVHWKDGGRIKYKRTCSIDGEEVAYSDIAKGYELPDGDMVVLTDDDLGSLPVASSHAVDVQTFVPADQIDPAALGKAYLVEPTGPDAKPYVLLRDVLERSGKVAVVKVALRQRERMATLRPRDGVLVLQTMMWPDELREAPFDVDASTKDLRPQELAMAESYVEALSGDFDGSAFHDEYRNALQQVIEAKIEGREVTEAPETSSGTGEVIDLMEALRRSVAEAKDRRSGAGSDSSAADASPDTRASKSGGKSAKKAAKKATAKKAPAKKAAGKKASAAKKTAPRKAARKTA